MGAASTKAECQRRIDSKQELIASYRKQMTRMSKAEKERYKKIIQGLQNEIKEERERKKTLKS